MSPAVVVIPRQSYLGNLTAQLDVDADSEVRPLTDGLMTIRHLFGFSDESLTEGRLPEQCERCAPRDIKDYLDGFSIVPVN